MHLRNNVEAVFARFPCPPNPTDAYLTGGFAVVAAASFEPDELVDQLVRLHQLVLNHLDAARRGEAPKMLVLVAKPPAAPAADVPGQPLTDGTLVLAARELLGPPPGSRRESPPAIDMPHIQAELEQVREHLGLNEPGAPRRHPWKGPQ